MATFERLKKHAYSELTIAENYVIIRYECFEEVSKTYVLIAYYLLLVQT